MVRVAAIVDFDRFRKLSAPNAAPGALATAAGEVSVLRRGAQGLSTAALGWHRGDPDRGPGLAAVGPKGCPQQVTRALLSWFSGLGWFFKGLGQAEKEDKDKIIKELTRKLSGPLADEDGNVPTGEDRPIAIEVDGPSHFYANSKQYTAYTKLKHRLLTRMGYKVLHVPYFEWRQLRSAQDREDYMRTKLKEEPSEWLDPEDEKYYLQGAGEEQEEFSVRPDWPDTPPQPPAKGRAPPPPPGMPSFPPPPPMK